MRTLLETPDRIVENGKFNLGVFKSPFRNLNMLDADPLMGGAAPRALRRLRLKDWQHYAVIHPDFYFGTVIFDAGITAKTFFFAYDRRTGKLHEQRRMLPPGAAKVAESLFDGRSSAKLPGYKLEYENHIDKGRHEIRADIAASKGIPALSGRFRALEDLSKVQPLIVSLPLGASSAMYSHKVVCPAEGELKVGGESVRLDPARDIALIDVHKAYYPRRFWWKWANFAAFDSKGRVIGANLTDNLIEDQRSWNECAIWHGPEISLLGPIKFEFDEADTKKPWRISDHDGRVELDFTPQGLKVEDLNLGVFKTHYRQPLGLFNGFLVDDSGEKHPVKDVFGVAEHMDSLL